MLLDKIAFRLLKNNNKLSTKTLYCNLLHLCMMTYIQYLMYYFYQKYSLWSS